MTLWPECRNIGAITEPKYPADAEHIKTLVEEGVHRGRIWTACELDDLASIPPLTEQDLVALSRLKLALGGEVVSVEPDEPSP